MNQPLVTIRGQYHGCVAIAHNERMRAASLPPGPEREDAKGWCRDLLAHASKLRKGFLQ